MFFHIVYNLHVMLDDIFIINQHIYGPQIVMYYLYAYYTVTTKGDACVCVFAKLDQFLPVRSQFDSNQHVNSVRIATFQCANFGPLLFAFYGPLLFYENKIKNEYISPHFAMF